MIQADICIIGAGSGGLSVAAFASQIGLKTVLIEKHLMGGDCLNYGCVPSKSLIAVAKMAHHVNQAALYGIDAPIKGINMQKVHDTVHGVINAIAPHDSQERFESLGCTVIREEGRFISKNQVQAGADIVQFRYCIIATGAKAAMPPIENLSNTPYLTNENIFNITQKIPTLAVIGGGTIGLELAQAHARLGSKVSVYSRSAILRDEIEAARLLVEQTLKDEGMNIVVGSVPNKVTHANNMFTLHFADGSSKEYAQLLVATGRKVNHNLDLDKANITYNDKAIMVNDNLRTTNKRVFAIGDVRGGPQFTHMAAFDAGVAIRNIIFKIPAKKLPEHLIPRVTFTDPEVAAIGLNEAEATQKYGAQNICVFNKNLSGNDRAQCEQKHDGFICIITHKKGHILGVHIASINAGELLNPWCLAMHSKLKIGAMASYLVPYPTMAEIGKQVAGQFYAPKLYTKLMQKIASFLIRL